MQAAAEKQTQMRALQQLPRAQPSSQDCLQQPPRSANAERMTEEQLVGTGPSRHARSGQLKALTISDATDGSSTVGLLSALMAGWVGRGADGPTVSIVPLYFPGTPRILRGEPLTQSHGSDRVRLKRHLINALCCIY